MSNDTMLINCFPLSLSPLTYTLPFLDYESWKISTNKLRDEYREFSWYRFKLDNERVRAVLFNGPAWPQHVKEVELDAAESPDFGKHIISRSLARHFMARGFSVSRTDIGSDTAVLKKSPEYSQNYLDIFSGISFQVRRPFETLPHIFTMSVQWEIKTSFNQSLADPNLRAIAVGMPVLYRPSAQPVVSEEMRRFVNRYLGHVSDINSNAEAVVDCKDQTARVVPLVDLYLEASPAVIREYEKRIRVRTSSRSLWYKLQELSLVLNAQGRRNTSVLKDRLQAIRAFLGGNSREQLIVSLACFQEGSITLSFSPMQVEAN